MTPFGIFFAPLPQIFWSDYLESPFVKCIDCEVPLPEVNLYVVQKRFVAKETVFEMAMCGGCREAMMAEYSDETRENITRFMMEHFRKNARKDLPESDEPFVMEIQEVEDPEEGNSLLNECLNYCVICGAERSTCHRYSLAGLCRDNEVVAQRTPISQTPMMVCDKCEMGMSSLISKKTRDSWDRFIAEHFDGPPGVEVDSPDSYPITF